MTKENGLEVQPAAAVPQKRALPFEQQPKESDKAFAAFAVYLGLGAERSLAATGKKLGKSKVMMERWSSKFDWPARVAAHGAHLALVEREDEYAGEGVPQGHRALGFALVYRAEDRTLTDDEVAKVHESLVAALCKGLALAQRI